MQRGPARRPVPRGAKPAKASKTNGRVSASLQDTREWVSGFINWDARTATILAVIVFGVFTVAPQVQNWFTYRQQISDMQAQVAAAKQSLKDMSAERTRWDDPVYVRAQARQRLYYVLPGEVSYLVMDAGSVNTSDTSGTVGAALAETRNTTKISSKVTTTSDNWVDTLGASVITAGIDQPATAAAKK